jgi:predicted O-methyltransferase YrrM
MKKMNKKKYQSYSNYNFIYNKIYRKRKINILEFGVNEGISTNMFLSLCDRKKGKLISVDIDDFSHLFNNKKWIFINSRDDNFLHIKKYIKNKLDVIYIDSYHEPNHIKKILYYYYKFLKKGGFIFIDDISWIPYVKNNYRENSWNEVINRNTFTKIVEIYNANIKNFNLEFCFDNSGMAMLKKINNNELIEPKKIPNSIFSFKNLIRIITSRKPKK